MPSKKNGVYRSKVRIGVMKDGTPINKYVSGKTLKELENAKDAVRDRYVFGRALPKEMPFFEYAEQWYKLKKEPFIGNASRASYRSCFLKYLLPEFGLQNMRAIDAGQIQKFVNGFAGMSKSHITLIIGILKGVFSSAMAEGMIDRDPTAALVRPKAQKQTERRALTKEETRRVLDVMRTNPDGLLLAVLYYLGLRRGEALGLKWGDFDLDENQVHIRRDIDYTGSVAEEGSLKTSAADRYVPVPPELKEMLLQHKGKKTEYVFHTAKGTPYSEATFKRIWLRLMMDCGCSEWRKVDSRTNRSTDIRKQVRAKLTPHFFRHNYATLLYESGVDPLVAMKILGHANYQTTADVYTHIRDEMLKKSTVNMAEVFRKREGE